MRTHALSLLAIVTLTTVSCRLGESLDGYAAGPSDDASDAADSSQTDTSTGGFGGMGAGGSAGKAGGTGGSAGSGGVAGTGGAGGTGGIAGSGGVAGTGGAGGTGGVAGTGGAGGTGGIAGSGGVAGTGGVGGTGGVAGTGGTAGSGGVAGTGGAGGTGGIAGSGGVAGTAGAGGGETTCPSGFVLIHAGEFMMGSPVGELGRDDDETEHIVKLTNAFCMQKTEVTQEQYKTEMGETPSAFIACGGNCPVERVSWNMAVKYCNKLSNNESLNECYTCNESSCSPAMNPYECNGYRLPTEAEWEYAARAGETTAFYNGDITSTDCALDPMLTKIGWYCGNSNSKTHPVEGKNPNKWGLLDMSGNVWEWCHDWYGSYSTSTITQNPTGPNSGSGRVIRGGSWYSGAKDCRSARRYSWPQGSRYNYIGFRPVVAPK